MTGFNHTLAGSIIAAITPPAFVPFVAFLSHFVLDAFPHFGRHPRFTPYNRPFRTLLIIDAVLCMAALLFAWWLFPDKWFIIAVGAGFSCLPDFMWLLDGRVRQLAPFFAFAKRIQWGERPWGWTLEIVYAVLMSLILVWLSGGFHL